ncbi:MAG: transketolase family protein [bacterium]|nr:transketolase family protein [bacterium]
MEKKATRFGYGEAIVELGKKNKNIVVLSADVTESTASHLFAKEFPERFFNVGISEQDLICEAAGLSLTGKIPFISAYSIFATGRAWEQIRNTVGYSHLNVKIVGTHAGLLVGPDGATHQALEDIALMRVIPNMKVVVPCDYIEAKKATELLAKDIGPAFLRLGRANMPIITNESCDFELGKAKIMKEGADATIFACGVMVSEALKAAEILAHEHISIEVVNIHTVKPIDRQAIVKFAMKTGAVVTAEEHQVSGGFGSAVLEVLTTSEDLTRFVPVEMVGMQDCFGESGLPYGLLAQYGLTDVEVVKAVKKVLQRKR